MLLRNIPERMRTCPDCHQPAGMTTDGSIDRKQHAKKTELVTTWVFHCTRCGHMWAPDAADVLALLLDRGAAGIRAEQERFLAANRKPNPKARLAA